MDGGPFASIRTPARVVPAPAPRAVTVRPVGPHDAPRLAELVRGLSPQSRYQRFHAGVRELSAATLARFTRFDPRCEMALIATLPLDDGDEIALGEARYAVVDGRRDAREFAVMVADEVQGLGLGARLLGALVQHARRAGVGTLFGDVLRDNLAMLALGRKFGFLPTRHPGDARLQRLQRVLAAGRLYDPSMQRLAVAAGCATPR